MTPATTRRRMRTADSTNHCTIAHPVQPDSVGAAGTRNSTPLPHTCERLSPVALATATDRIDGPRPRASPCGALGPPRSALSTGPTGGDRLRLQGRYTGHEGARTDPWPVQIPPRLRDRGPRRGAAVHRLRGLPGGRLRDLHVRGRLRAFPARSVGSGPDPVRLTAVDVP